jgi:hypothetical protein
MERAKGGAAVGIFGYLDGVKVRSLIERAIAEAKYDASPK